jgi:hypothetical protein
LLDLTGGITGMSLKIGKKISTQSIMYEAGIKILDNACNIFRKRMSEMSNIQRNKVLMNLNKNPERVKKSDWFKGRQIDSTSTIELDI